MAVAKLIVAAVPVRLLSLLLLRVRRAPPHYVFAFVHGFTQHLRNWSLYVRLHSLCLCLCLSNVEAHLGSSPPWNDTNGSRGTLAYQRQRDISLGIQTGWSAWTLRQAGTHKQVGKCSVDVRTQTGTRGHTPVR